MLSAITNQQKKFLPMQLKKTGNQDETLENILAVPDGEVNEKNYSIFHESNGVELQKANNFSLDHIVKRDIYKIIEPLKEASEKTRKRFESKSQLTKVKDPLSNIMKKHSTKRKNLKLDTKIFNSETLEICNISDDLSKNSSFNISFKKRLTKDVGFFTPVKPVSSKKMKKPKIFKSDGKTVTAESVLRMVDPSFLVCSDVDDSSMASMNTSTNVGNAPLKLNNFLDDINNFDQIDRFLSVTDNKAQKASLLRNRIL